MSQRMASKLHLPIEPINQPIILADGTTVPCGGLVRNVSFCPTDSFCELVDILVFPLATHDILVGMSWMQAHHVHISCAARALGFWSRNCTDFTAYNQHHICCTATLHADIASLANMDMLNMLTCNQFKKFLKDDLDVENCVVFVKNTPEALPLLAIEEDMGRAQTRANIDVALETMRARVDLPTSVRDKFCNVLSSYATTVFEDSEYSSLEDALSRDVEHEINEIPHQAHPCRPVYRLSPVMMDELRTQVNCRHYSP